MIHTQAATCFRSVSGFSNRVELWQPINRQIPVPQQQISAGRPSIQKTETVWEEFTKLPGEGAVATGTATRAPHRPKAKVEASGNPER